MGAPTNAANVKKALANSEPSTHGGKAEFAIGRLDFRFEPDQQHGPCRGFGNAWRDFKEIRVTQSLLELATEAQPFGRIAGSNSRAPGDKFKGSKCRKPRLRARCGRPSWRSRSSS